MCREAAFPPAVSSLSGGSKGPSSSSCTEYRVDLLSVDRHPRRGRLYIECGCWFPWIILWQLAELDPRSCSLRSLNSLLATPQVSG